MRALCRYAPERVIASWCSNIDRIDMRKAGKITGWSLHYMDLKIYLQNVLVNGKTILGEVAIDPEWLDLKPQKRIYFYYR